MTANKKKEKVFENFRSPFGNHGNYVKVLFKIAIDEKLNKDNPTRTTFVNLNNANDKRLTEHPENDQVLFAMPQFEITSYVEFPETWYNELNTADREAYDKLWEKDIKDAANPKKGGGHDEEKDKAKEELNIQKNMFKRYHDVKDEYEKKEDVE